MATSELKLIVCRHMVNSNSTGSPLMPESRTRRMRSQTGTSVETTSYSLPEL